MDNVLFNERNQLVVKSNVLIQQTRHSLSLQEQKTILYLISKITDKDTEFQEYTFDLKHLCDICGIESSGQNYQNFKNSIQTLADKSFWIRNGNKESLCRWIEKAYINHGTTTITIRLDNDLMPFLLELREQYTMYELGYVLVMKSKYSIRIYELLKSYAYKKQLRISIEDLKRFLCITDKYKVYKDFRQYVIDVAIKDINECSDLNITYKPIRTAHKITELLFDIQRKDKYESAGILYYNNKNLGIEEK